ncbi:substrate import-associated zinc metallohydrolase lipoprotein [Gelidibacter algens]|uniref:Substrate import-associated zinc metallohydrolase lipoprotein n=1 Tax=Gelidibacter algens TaxID=49280 RepID=A0A1A7R0Z5_9FLAO|nr:substrate import-associated zinc metallohydrolase lipoprotein [Gelidibacter algens]OBX25193.1 hypothetical protein A9996_11285 [Gelidibacter algens]RAJ22512.1 substrate import-associated zinc metallohydrolase lipoprotein [Gelidibacter algens]
MKDNFLNRTFVIAIILAVFTTSCSNVDDSVGPSQIDTTPPILNELDLYLRNSFVIPYNIDIQYKWDINDTSVNRFLHPPFQSNVKPMATLLQDVWIAPYTAVGGVNFIKNIAPREFILSGGFNYNPNSPTITLGIAEAGARITLFNLDELDYSSIVYDEDTNNDFEVQLSIVGPISTVHHEYGHILNQNVPFDPAFEKITPGDYTAQWFNRSNEQARELGFITAYASNQPGEDFVEMIAQMLVRTRADYDALVNSISSQQAKDAIRLKEQFVVDYYQDNFDIDFYALQELTSQALIDAVN